MGQWTEQEIADADAKALVNYVAMLEARLALLEWRPIETKPPHSSQNGIIVTDGIRRWFDDAGILQALGNWLGEQPKAKWWFQLPPLPDVTAPDAP